MITSKLKAAAVLVALQVAAGVGVFARQGAEAPATPSTTDRPVSILSQPAKMEAEPARLEMTLDMAIERCWRENPDLGSKFYEIPQAKADTLTAGLRANPLVYADSRLVPCGYYSRDRPGSQSGDIAQYDVNVSYPLDFTGKRQARAAAKSRATKVTEAQYQDAVRLQIHRLSSAFVEALSARRLAELGAEAVDRLDRLAEAARRRGEGRDGLGRVEATRAEAATARDDLADLLDRKTRELASILGLPEAQAVRLEVVGDLDQVAAIPPTENLIAQALIARPDLASYRLGLERARADVKAQVRSRLDGAYLLYQPYAIRRGDEDPLSWALGIQIPMDPTYAPWDSARRYPLPASDRDPGDTRRAGLNVGQTQVETAALERQVISEVGDACRECTSALGAARGAGKTADEARRALDEAWAKYEAGESTIPEFLEALTLDCQAGRLLVEAQARHWRGRLSVNTAVGRRVLP